MSAASEKEGRCGVRPCGQMSARFSEPGCRNGVPNQPIRCSPAHAVDNSVPMPPNDSSHATSPRASNMFFAEDEDSYAAYP